MNKKLLVIAASAFTFGLISISCKKTEPCKEEVTPPLPMPVVLEPFYAKVDGTEFEEISLGAQEFSDKIVISTQNSFSRFFHIELPPNITSGTYSFFDPQVDVPNIVYFDSTTYYAAATGTGTLNIVEHNLVSNKISGTFSFDAVPYSWSTDTNTYSITEGEFSVNYN